VAGGAGRTRDFSAIARPAWRYERWRTWLQEGQAAHVEQSKQFGTVLLSITRNAARPGSAGQPVGSPPAGTGGGGGGGARETVR
jgi:hypothetical protein